MEEQHLTEDTDRSVFEFTIPNATVSYEGGREPSATSSSVETTVETTSNNTKEATVPSDATIGRSLKPVATMDTNDWTGDKPADTSVSSEIEVLKGLYTVTKGIRDISDLLDDARGRALGGRR